MIAGLEIPESLLQLPLAESNSQSLATPSGRTFSLPHIEARDYLSRLYSGKFILGAANWRFNSEIASSASPPVLPVRSSIILKLNRSLVHGIRLLNACCTTYHVTNDSTDHQANETHRAYENGSKLAPGVLRLRYIGNGSYANQREAWRYANERTDFAAAIHFYLNACHVTERNASTFAIGVHQLFRSEVSIGDTFNNFSVFEKHSGLMPMQDNVYIISRARRLKELTATRATRDEEQDEDDRRLAIYLAQYTRY